MTLRIPSARGVVCATVWLVSLAAVGLAGGSVWAEETPARKPDAKVAGAALQERIDAAIAKGVAYLVTSQNEDGSWGSPAPNLHVDIYAPRPGSNRAFMVGASALALSALVEVGGDAPEVRAAIRRGTDFLLRRHAVRRIRPDTLYNVWAHMYSLEAFARLLAREKRDGPRQRLMKAAQSCVSWMQRMEFVEGGWGYYNFGIKTRDPGPGATSFTSATGVVALEMAKRQGVEVPPELIRKANNLIRACAIPGGSFAYSYRTRLSVQHRTNGNINRTKGSLARTPACLLAWALSEEEVDPQRYVQTLDELDRFGYMLRLARKYPRPHEVWYGNSGYFCFYGYYYAGMLLEHVPGEQRARYAAVIASDLLPLQEKDGSWWDYQLYRVHKPYGTGYVLMALGRCREEGPSGAGRTAEPTRDAAAVLKAFVPGWVVEDFNRKPTALLLHAMTRADSLKDGRWTQMRESLTKSLEGLRVDTLDDYEKQKARPMDLRKILTSPPPLHFITRDEYKAAMGTTETSHSYDARLRKLIGQHEGARDVRSVSAPGVSADGRQALLYAEWHMGARAAGGSYYLLAWEAGRWKVVDEAMAWIS